MKKRDFNELIKAKWAEGKFVCIGLDSEFSKIPECMQDRPTLEGVIYAFNMHVIDATKDIVCAYKPNIAFYAAYGDKGALALQMTIDHIRQEAPDVPVILDSKRADIGNTNRGYVAEAFDYFGADAVTVHPYLGREALQPLLDQKDKGIFVLARTSNPGGGEFQNIVDHQGWPLWRTVANHVANHGWNENGNCGVVAGATYPEELAVIRQTVGDMPMLIPGIGKQGGDLEGAVKGGMDSRGEGFIINSSSGIIFASQKDDFDTTARKEANKLQDQITVIREQAMTERG